MNEFLALFMLIWAWTIFLCKMDCKMFERGPKGHTYWNFTFICSRLKEDSKFEQTCYHGWSVSTFLQHWYKTRLSGIKALWQRVLVQKLKLVSLFDIDNNRKILFIIVDKFGKETKNGRQKCFVLNNQI